MKRLLTCLLALLLTACANYKVLPEEQTVKAVMTRWAKDHDKSLKWDIEDLGIVEPDALNHQLWYTHSLTEAVSVFMNLAERSRIRLAAEAREPRPDPVMACIYDNAIWVTYHRSAAIACSQTVLPSSSR